MPDWAKVHEKSTLSPGMIPLAGYPICYGLAVRIRTRAYENKKKKELPGFVLSIGNLTVGERAKPPRRP